MTSSNSIKRGVSLYSFQEEYFLRKMSLEDILAACDKLDIRGIEILGDQMIPNYPNISPAFFDQWHGWMGKYNLQPVCLDMFLDWNKFNGRIMTDDERLESIKKDIVNANKLGCTVIRVIHDVNTGILERAAETAEKNNVILALEIHAPSYYDSPFEQELLKLYQRMNTPYLGFTLDMGVYCKKVPRVAIERLKRDGMKNEIADYLEQGYNNGTLPTSHELGVVNEELPAIIRKMGGTEEDVMGAFMATHMIYGDPAILKDYIPYTYHVHGKFYEMLPDYTEYSIPYEEIIPILQKGGFKGYIDSEYEGNRWIQDAYDVDSVEQVRRQHVMLKRLLGEEK